MEFIKKMSKWFLFIICFLLIIESVLYIYKYFYLKNIYKNTEIIDLKTLNHKNKIFRYGNKGNYPILQVSADNKIWKTINVRGFFYDAIPNKTSFSDMKVTHNTIWFKELEWNIEYDCGSKIYNFFYSHDNGNTWNSISPKENCTYIDFKNDKDGTMFYNEGQILYTHDGGKTWNK